MLLRGEEIAVSLHVEQDFFLPVLKISYVVVTQCSPRNLKGTMKVCDKSTQRDLVFTHKAGFFLAGLKDFGVWL